MRLILRFAALLCALPLVCSATIEVTVVPAQESLITHSLRRREELKPLAAEYQRFIATRLHTLTSDQIPKVFGTKLETLRPLSPHRLTNNVALPLFAPEFVSLSSLLVTNDQSHADLYAVGEVGYAEFIYQWDGILKNARIVLFFRPDATFVPLKTEEDFSRRLRWEKSKWRELQNWFDVHLPQATNR